MAEPLRCSSDPTGERPIYNEPGSTHLTNNSGRPVKVTMSRTDVFEATGQTGGAYIKLKAAVKGDKLTAVQATLAYEAGAFPGSPVGAGSMTMLSPYNIENFEINAYDVVLNKP